MKLNKKTNIINETTIADDFYSTEHNTAIPTPFLLFEKLYGNMYMHSPQIPNINNPIS